MIARRSPSCTWCLCRTFPRLAATSLSPTRPQPSGTNLSSLPCNRPPAPSRSLTPLPLIHCHRVSHAACQSQGTRSKHDGDSPTEKICRRRYYVRMSEKILSDTGFTPPKLQATPDCEHSNIDLFQVNATRTHQKQVVAGGACAGACGRKTHPIWNGTVFVAFVGPTVGALILEIELISAKVAIIAAPCEPAWTQASSPPWPSTLSC